MDDVIELMARALDDGDYPMATYRRDVIDMLDAAEKAGWRLVPVEPTHDMNEAMCCELDEFLAFEDQARTAWRDAIKAAPRPWREGGTNG